MNYDFEDLEFKNPKMILYIYSLVILCIFI